MSWLYASGSCCPDPKAAIACFQGPTSRRSTCQCLVSLLRRNHSEIIFAPTGTWLYYGVHIRVENIHIGVVKYGRIVMLMIFGLRRPLGGRPGVVLTRTAMVSILLYFRLWVNKVIFSLQWWQIDVRILFNNLYEARRFWHFSLFFQKNASAFLVLFVPFFRFSHPFSSPFGSWYHDIASHGVGLQICLGLEPRFHFMNRDVDKRAWLINSVDWLKNLPVAKN